MSQPKTFRLVAVAVVAHRLPLDLGADHRGSGEWPVGGTLIGGWVLLSSGLGNARKEVLGR